MPRLLNLLRGSLGSGPASEIAAHLRRLAASRDAIEIEPLHASISAGRIFSIVEDVKPSHFVIARPTGPGAHRPLIRFGQYSVLLPHGDRTMAGTSKVIARVRVRSGDGDSALFCYQMSYPTDLRPVDRKADQRLLFGGAMQCEARVRALGRSSPIFGSIRSLTASEIRIACRHSVSLPQGASVNVEAELPPPVGHVNAVGELVAMEQPPGEAGPVLKVRFLENHPGILAAIERGMDGT